MGCVMTTLRLGLFLALLLCLECNAQEQYLELGAELRPRVLLDAGYRKPRLVNEPVLVYASQRTRLSALFHQPNTEVYVVFQDVRFWGNDTDYSRSGSFGNRQSISLHQGWVKYWLSKDLTLKAGRQLFVFDDQRLLSSRNWNDTQVTYDALLLTMQKGRNSLDVAVSYNVKNNSSLMFPSMCYKTFDFVRYGFKGEQLNVSALSVLAGQTKSDSTSGLNYKLTWGVHSVYRRAATSIQLSAYYQHNLNRWQTRASAWCLASRVDQQLSESFNLGLGFDYLSGNETPATRIDRRFDILYGRRHSFYGHMDYFNTIPDAGLQDLMLTASLKPSRSVSLFLDFHQFWLAKRISSITSIIDKYDRNLGQEIDIKFQWQQHDNAILEVGCAYYLSSNTLKYIKGMANQAIRTPCYAYVMLTIKPTFRLMEQ